MGHLGRKIDEKGNVLIGPDEAQNLLDKKVFRINSFVAYDTRSPHLLGSVLLEDYFLIVFPQLEGIILKGVAGPPESKPVVPAVVGHLSRRHGDAGFELSELGGPIPRLLEDLSEGPHPGGPQFLRPFLQESGKIFLGGFEIVADGGMTRVQPGEKTHPGGNTDGVGRVEIREAQTFSGHFINVGCLDEFLTVAAETGISQIIGIDQDDVRPLLLPRPAACQAETRQNG